MTVDKFTDKCLCFVLLHIFAVDIEYRLSVLGHDFFICWITSHFQEFQSAAIGKKIKVKIELEPKI